MAEKAAGAVVANQPDEEEDRDQPQNLGRSRERDPFADAFKAAEKQLAGDTKPAKPKKPAAKDDDGDEEDEPAPAKKKPQQKPAKAKEEAPDDDEDEGEDDPAPRRRSGEAAKSAKPSDDRAAAGDEKKPEAKPKEPLKAKDWWSNERRSSFAYQPRHVQEAWLDEAPAPNQNWPTEVQEVFARQPREAQEAMLGINQEITRGYTEKFQALAAERKLAEGIRAVPTPEQRTMMQQRGLNEVQTFTALMRLQEQSARDPVGYVRDFIMRNKIDPRTVLGNEAGGGENSQGNPPRADIRSDPAFRSLQAELNAIKAERMEEVRRRDEENDRKLSGELSGVLAETDEDGNPAYPYARLLQAQMAHILTTNPEQFDSMGVRDRFVTAYQLALKEFPELLPPPKAAKPTRADERDDEDPAEPDEGDEDEAKLKKAATKKSRRPAAASHDRGDPFDVAFRKAEKRLGQR